ncbi:MAG: SusD/RagB family nutrient-binding outer membrane lipoprotein [Cytophagales bacterium]|nr:MAG: SusD/RagB family nutrient-binding outer membrane lipoprotein [Cytophagales bacterium]
MQFWKKTLSILTAGFLLASCESYVDKVDEIDPTAPTDANIPALMTATQVAYQGVMEGEMARLAGMWSGYFTGSDRQYTTLYNYNAVSADFDGSWGNVFAGVIKNARLLRQKGIAAGNRSVQGVAKIMEAHTMGTSAALWGDVPFTQAANLAQFPNPTYDSQTAVYAAVQTLLSEAITDLSANVGTISGDYMYDGGRAFWVSAANTLKARFFLHQGQYQQAINFATNGIKNPDLNLYAYHNREYQKTFNIYYSFLTYDRSGYMTAEGAHAVRLLDAGDRLTRNNTKTDEEARLNFYYQSGLNTGSVEPNVLSSFDWGNDPTEDGFFAAEARFPLVTFEENQLILAESQARLAQTAPALASLNLLRSYYNSGLNLNEGYRGLGLRYAPYVLADFNAGGIENRAGTRSAEQALLFEILEERYITFIGQIEGFNDIRRTNNALRVPANTGTQIPRRFLYSQAEINANTSAPRPTPDLFTPTAIFK